MKQHELSQQLLKVSDKMGLDAGADVHQPGGETSCSSVGTKTNCSKRMGRRPKGLSCNCVMCLCSSSDQDLMHKMRHGEIYPRASPLASDQNFWVPMKWYTYDEHRMCWGLAQFRFFLHLVSHAIHRLPLTLTDREK